MKSNSHYQYIPIELVTKEPDKEGGYYLLKDRWWKVEEDNIVFAYYTSPQCNKSKTVFAELAPELKFIRKAWIPIDYNGVYDIRKLMI